MVQGETIQVDIAFLTFNPKLNADRPSVRQDNSCLVTLKELRDHRDHKRCEKEVMGVDAYHHYKWYNSMLSLELKARMENSQLKVIHWYIESGNTEAFMMNNILYKSVSIIIGAKMEHWYCANTGEKASHSHGSRYRTNNSQHESNVDKIACFTIDDDEATFVVSNSFEGFTHCTAEVCANNCIKCKKFQSPFTQVKSKCVCFPCTDDFESFAESDFENESDSDSEDIATVPQFFERRGIFNRKFKLNPIREESYLTDL